MTISPGRAAGAGTSATFRLPMPSVSRSSYRFISRRSGTVVGQDLLAEELHLLLADFERQESLVAEPGDVLGVAVLDELVHALANVGDRSRHQVLRLLHAIDRPLLARQHLTFGVARQAQRFPETEMPPEPLPEHAHRAVLAILL